MSSKTTVLAIVSTVVIGAAAAGATTFWSSQNTYALKVNGEVISMDKYQTALNRAKKQYEGQIGMDFKSEKGQKALKNIQENIAKSLTEIALLKQEAQKMNLKLSDQEIETKVNEFIKGNYKDNKEAFEADLKKHRFTMTEFKEQMAERLLVQKLYEDVIKDVKVEDKDIQDYYNKNIDQFKVPEQIEAQHILIKADEPKGLADEKDEKKKEALKAAEDKKALAKANQLISQLKAGADFAKLAKEHSADPGSKDNGGKYTFPKGQMVPEFEKAAWDAKPGELVSEPVKTQFGYHIIKRGKSLPGSTKPLSEVKTQIQSTLEKTKTTDYFKEWLETRKKAAQVDVNGELGVTAKEILAEEPPAPAMGAGGHDGHDH